MRFLPRPGMWMVRVRQLMGVLVLATAIWFGYILFQQIAVKREAFARAAPGRAENRAPRLRRLHRRLVHQLQGERAPWC